jgi:UDP-N-acetylglucosamine 2-epimerase (non-hydrolysing)
MIKIVTVIGCRPDIIRLSLITAELDKWFNNITVDTGQHYDYNLNKVMYEQLGVREPNYRLETKAATQVEQIGRIMVEFERVLKDEQPAFVVILGDNNSSLATALVAANLNIPIVHIESGGRSFNWKMPEEKNRTVVDHLAAIHFCYTEEHRANLLRENIDSRSIWVVGNPIVDVTFSNKWRIQNSILPYSLLHKEYVLVTCHRAENVTNTVRLNSILKQLNELRESLAIPVVIIEMPKLREAAKDGYGRLTIIEPQPYLSFLNLMNSAALVISDSGTVPEECYTLGVPCLQIREKTERVELLQNRSTILVDVNDDIVTAAKFLLSTDYSHSGDTSPYNREVASKIVAILLGNAQKAWGKYS